jgi:hypothetical protein
MPGRAISSEDTVAEKVFPFCVEGLSFAVVDELGCQYRFEVRWVGGEDCPDTKKTSLSRP